MKNKIAVIPKVVAEAPLVLCDHIRPGDRVTILRPAGRNRDGSYDYKPRTGRAVMRNREQGCWVLNLGGPHGTPGIADEENIVCVKRGNELIYGNSQDK